VAKEPLVRISSLLSVFISLVLLTYPTSMRMAFEPSIFAGQRLGHVSGS
jgi:hypothetical protein